MNIKILIRLTLFNLAFFIFTSASYGQEEKLANIDINGLTVDSTSNLPIKYTLIKVNNKLLKKNDYSSVADSNGYFSLKLNYRDSLIMIFTAIGYVTKQLDLKLSSDVDTAINLNKVKMRPVTNNLKEVTVQAERSIVKQLIDRISYNVQLDPDSKVLSALDILRKVPLISVTGDDKILMKGNSSFMILLNGKPTSLFVNDPSQVLKSMPASSIESIEVITTPPSK